MSLADRLSIALAAGMAQGAAHVAADDVPWDEAFTPAAVLVAITDRPNTESGPGVILTQRPEHMRNHAGQVAFPGGRIDASDADHIAAALREAFEEIALDPALVHIIGQTDTYQTGTGYHITPVIGVIPPDLPLHPNDDEVADIFEVPLAYLLDPANHQYKTGLWQGVMRNYYEIQWQDRSIWGATAAMLVNLARRLA